MIEVVVKDGSVEQTLSGTPLDVALDYLLAISSAYNRIKSRYPLGSAVFRAAITSAVDEDSPVWSDLHGRGGVGIELAPGAEDVIKRVIEEGGGSVTAIDLTRDQCVALANFLRRTVDRGMDSGYDEIELLVLAQRALRNAAKPTVRVPLCDVPKSGTPEGGVT